ncbi:MAG TPA: transcriptional regulator NrdR [Alphaproteobacteria bacterium]|nr:transcriptional regulator NrdR [Alphaproteobacteria bacterium]
MKCPFCGSKDLKVVDKRESDSDTYRRRRECNSCGKRFTTYERVELELKIIKKDGRREPYDRAKLLKGISKSLDKRPIGSDKINAMVDDIEAELFRLEKTEIEGDVVGEVVMKHLKELDEIAYIRFASVYRQFKDIKDLEKEIKSLK